MFSSYAISEEISPFGFTLGSKLDSKYFDDDIKLYPSGRCIQKVNPTVPNENFRTYTVCISPISHTIFQIKGAKYIFQNNYGKRCKPFTDDLTIILKEKYNFLSFESKDSNWASLENEFLSIQIRCNDKKAYDLMIVYELISEEIYSLRKEEEVLFIENRKNKIDTTGL